MSKEGSISPKMNGALRRMQRKLRDERHFYEEKELFIAGQIAKQYDINPVRNRAQICKEKTEYLKSTWTLSIIYTIYIIFSHEYHLYSTKDAMHYEFPERKS